jgi:hypothetical protein
MIDNSRKTRCIFEYAPDRLLYYFRIQFFRSTGIFDQSLKDRLRLNRDGVRSVLAVGDEIDRFDALV